jgi:hypothetical protein
MINNTQRQKHAVQASDTPRHGALSGSCSRFVLRSVGFLLLLALVGCGQGPKMAEVSGKVSVDGKPIEKGAITFIPENGVGPTTGGTIEEGEYAVLVPYGRMKVSISAPKVVGMKKLYNTKHSIERPVTAESLPARYNEKTELVVDVAPAKNEKNWELMSK